MTATTLANKPIERISAANLSPCEWHERFVAGSQPVVLTDLPSGPLATRCLSLESFVNEYGDVPCRWSDASFMLPHAKSTQPLRDFAGTAAGQPSWWPDALRAPLPYIFHDVLGNDQLHFDSTHPSAAIPLEDEWPPPRFFAALSQTHPCVAARIALGPRHSHCGLHTHGAALNMLAFGRKRWFLYPLHTVRRLIKLIFGARVPSPQLFWLQQFHPLARDNGGNITELFLQTAEKLQRQNLYELPKSGLDGRPLLAADLRGIEVDQHPGEAVFIPDGWGHWILNRDFSLAIVYQLELAEAQPDIAGNHLLEYEASDMKLRYLRSEEDSDRE